MTRIKKWFIDVYLEHFIPIIMFVPSMISFILLSLVFRDLAISISISTIVVLICTSMIGYRNIWVFDKRKKLIYHVNSDLYMYLPSYERMLATFWIWDINQYLPSNYVNESKK